MTRAPQVGDRIQVTGTVTHCFANGDTGVQFDGDARGQNTLTAFALAKAEFLSRPLKVGDRVTHLHGFPRAGDGQILVIDEAAAGVKWDRGSDRHGFYSLSDLTLADSEGQK